MNKINKLFALSALFLVISQLIFMPIVSAAKSEGELANVANPYTNLTGFRKCVNETLNTRGIALGDKSPLLNQGVVVPVGHHVVRNDGSLNCWTESGDRIDIWFRLLGYSSWNDYKSEKSGNLKNCGDKLYFVNNNSCSNKLSDSDAKKKLTTQIDKKIEELLQSYSTDERKALRVYILWQAFFIGCEAKPITADANSDNGDTLSIDGQTYSVNNDGRGIGGGQIAVGLGQRAANNSTGYMKCNAIKDGINADIKTYKAITNSTTPPAASGDNESKNQEDKSCEAQGGVLSWIMCPVIEMVGTALNWIDTQLQRLLTVDEDKYSSPQMYTAWSRFRNIGLTLLIAAMMIMVISTALGVGFLDAYTVKKAMPRMIMSVLFMLLSWYICLFLIKLSNVVGKGTLGLMTSPFPDASSLTELFTPSAGGAAIQIGGIAIGAVAVVAGVGVFGIVLSWLGTGLLIMAIAFLVLIARQMVIIVLILFSPLAILSWIFPNNNKLWKFWWETFTKLLLMFPIVMALIASGRIFAGVIANTPGGGAEGGLLNGLLKLTAYVLPYAFIPFTFKAAGGAFGNLVGMANDKSRGAFDRLKKGRQQKYGQIGRNIKGGVGFRGSNASLLNRATAGVAAGPQGWVPGKRGRNYRAAKRETGQTVAGASQLENDTTYKANKGNDAFLLAMADDRMLQAKINKEQAVLDSTTATAEERRSAEANIANLNRARALASTVQNQTAGTRRQAALDLAATGYQFDSGADGYEQLARMAESVTGYSRSNQTGDRAAFENFMDNAQYNLGKAGRFDLGGINHGAGYDPEKGLGKASLWELANAKPDSITAMTEGIPPGPTGAQSQKAAIVYKELQSMRSNAKGGVAKEIDKQMAALEAGGVHDYINTPSGRTYVDSSGVTRPAVVPGRVDFDSAKAAVDPTYSASWSPDEQARGWRSENRPETLGDIAGREARPYVPPDPHTM